jgi:hypothetical protein
MTPDTPNPASAAARTGSGKHHKRLASDFHDFKLPATHAQALSRLRRQRLVEHLHRLGPAPLGYFLREVEAGAKIPDHLERYARIDHEFVRALGGDRFAPSIHMLDGGSP